MDQHGDFSLDNSISSRTSRQTEKTLDPSMKGKTNLISWECGKCKRTANWNNAAKTSCCGLGMHKECNPFWPECEYKINSEAMTVKGLKDKKVGCFRYHARNPLNLK